MTLKKIWQNTPYFLLLLLILLLFIPYAPISTTPDTAQRGKETPMAYMPVARKEPTLTPTSTPTPTPTPTPIPTPTFTPSQAEVLFQITPNGGLQASTFNSGSFVLTNLPGHDLSITRVRIDLSTALFPDMVFDPDGEAGDQLAKDVTIDEITKGVRYRGRRYQNPHDDGFDILELDFEFLIPGKEVTFSVDVDPTSIRGVGAPGPNESGSVSGLELTGATITIFFDNDLSLTGQTYAIPGSIGGSEVRLRQYPLPPPVVEVLDVPVLPATVSTAEQVIRIYGAQWQTASLLLVEGGLFTTGLPGGGFDLDPFEANTAVQVESYNALIGSQGFVDIPLTLTQLQAESGLNYIAVVLADSYGLKGQVTAPLIIQLVNNE